MKKKLSLTLALFILISAALCGCGTDKAKTNPTPATNSEGEYRLADIPSDAEKSAIEGVLQKFITSYEENAPADAYALFTSSFEGTAEDIASFFEEIRKVCKNPFIPFDGYYLSGLTISDLPVKVRHTEQDSAYVEIVPVSKELYCGMYVSEGEKTSYMLNALLTKEKGSWKIAWITPGTFKYNGEDAPVIYEKTMELYNNGNLISAYIYSCMLANTFRPGEYMRYEKDAEMEDICYKLYSEVSDKFPSPLALENTSNSEVHSIQITYDEKDGIMPLLLVKTDALISDRDGLVAEAKKVVDAIEKLSPGFKGSFTHAAFSVTNDNIDENNPTPTVSESFVLALNQ